MVNRTYTDLSKVSAELNGLSLTGSTTPSSTTVSTWIEEATAEIEGRVDKIYGSVSFDIYMDYNGQSELRIPNHPILSIGTLSYDDAVLGTTRSWHTLTADTDYIFYPEEGVIKLIGTSIPSGYRNIRIIGYYGTSTVPLNVQRLATLLTAKRVIGSVITGSSTSEGGSIKVDVIEISDPSTFSLGNVQRMNNEIDRLYMILGTFKSYRLIR